MHDIRSKILRAERRNLPANFASLDRPVIAVSAPAGYGKSTLLAEWRRDVIALGFQFVSLVVDADDRDGDRLLLDLLNAFAPADAKRSQMLLGGVGDRGRRAIIMALLAELAAREQRTVLFIDDLHWLDDSAAESILRLLVGHQPERLALVLSGRSNLTGPQARRCSKDACVATVLRSSRWTAPTSATCCVSITWSRGRCWSRTSSNARRDGPRRCA